MKRIYLLITILLTVAVAYAQSGEVAINGAWMKKHYSKAEYMIPMHDGVKLYTAVYIPKNKKVESPILLCRSERACEPYGKKMVTLWRDAMFEPYLQAEYILAFQEVRGKGCSGGETVDAGLESDTYHTIEWLQKKLRRHNGRVGVWGVGEDCTHAMRAAMSVHPAICAVSPQAIMGKVEVDKPVTAAVLLVDGGMNSDSKDKTWRQYDVVRQKTPQSDCRLVVGPWSLGAWRKAGALADDNAVEDVSADFFLTEIEFPFFEHYLRGAENSGASSAGAIIYFTGENCWRELSGEDFRRAKEHKLYLSDDGRLVKDLADAGGSTSSRYDAATPDDVLTFVSSVLEEDMTALGGVELQLYVTTSKECPDFKLMIIDESANAEHEVIVREDVYKGKELAQTQCEGGVKLLSFRLCDIAHTFFAGGRVKLKIQCLQLSSDNSPNDTPEVYLHHDAKHTSLIRLKVMQ